MSGICHGSRARALHLGLVLSAAVWGIASEARAGQPSGNYEQKPFFGCGKAQAMAATYLAEEAIPGHSADRAEAMEDTDVRHCKLEIELTDIDPDAHNCTITGRNRMTIRSESASLTEFTFRLRSQYTITAAYVDDTIPVTVDTESTTTRVAALDRTYGMGEEFALTIEYTGTSVSGGWGSILVTTQSDIPVVSSFSCPYYAYTWWPAKDGNVALPGDNSDKTTMEFSITVPDNMTVPSNGALQSTEPLPDDRVCYNWATDYPISTYLVSFAATEYNTWTLGYDHSRGTMPVEFYIYPSNDNPANRAAWGQAVDMIEVFATLYGEYPFINDKYGIYNFPFGGGMEHQTMTGQGSFSESLTAHELSHQWWGDMITCETWSDVWLNEGFAVYSECLWEEFKTGTPDPTAYLDAVLDHKPTGAGAEGSVYVYPEDIASGGMNRIFDYNLTYLKAGWVMHQLRHVVGDATFFGILENYRSAYAFSSATTDDFIGVASATYGEDLTWFFDQWVYQVGAPAYEYGWDTINVAGQDYLAVEIRQVQDPSYPEVFVMPVDLVVTIGGGEETITIWNDQRIQWFAIPVGGPVTDCQFDPNEWILRISVAEFAYDLNPPAAAPPPHDARKNRYVSFNPNSSAMVAFRLAMTASDYFPESIGNLGWIGEPFEAPDPGVWIARVVETPFYTNAWPAVVHVGDCPIVPAATYEIEATVDETLFLEALVVGTILEPAPKYWADCVGALTRDAWTGPNGVVNMDDVMAAVQKFKQFPSAPHLTWMDIDPEIPNAVLNFADIQMIVQGFKGNPYPFGDPASCP